MIEKPDKEHQFRYRIHLLLYLINRGVFLIRPPDERFDRLARPIAGALAKGGEFTTMIVQFLQASNLERLQAGLDKIGLLAKGLDVLSNPSESEKVLREIEPPWSGIWINTTGPTRQFMLLDEELIAEVLDNSPKMFGPTDSKRKALDRFMPLALTITEDSPAFEIRREANEKVLELGRKQHGAAPAYLEVISSAVFDRNVDPESAERIDWTFVDDIGIRVALEVVLGQNDPDVISKLRNLMVNANRRSVLISQLGAPLEISEKDAPAFRELLEKLREPVRHAVQVLFDSSDEEFEPLTDALIDHFRREENVQNPTSLIGRLAHYKSNRPGAEEHLARIRQVPHWIFAIRGTLDFLAFYTLTMLAIHPQARARAMAEVDDIAAKSDDDTTRSAEYVAGGLAFLENCIMEAGRLWPPVPLLFRRLRTPLKEGMRLKAVGLEPGDAVLIHNAALFRMGKFVGANPGKFDPDRWGLRGESGDDLRPRIEGYWQRPTVFSDGPQVCPGRDLGLFLVKTVVMKLLQAHEYTAIQHDGKPFEATDELPVVFDPFAITIERRARV